MPNHIQVTISGGTLIEEDPIPHTRSYTATVLVDDEAGRFLAEAEAQIKRNVDGMIVNIAQLQQQIPDDELLKEVVAEIRKAVAKFKSR